MQGRAMCPVLLATRSTAMRGRMWEDIGLDEWLRLYRKGTPASTVCVYLLLLADDHDADDFVDRLPEDLRGAFEAAVFAYPVDTTERIVSFRRRPANRETVRNLRAAFERRRLAAR